MTLRKTNLIWAMTPSRGIGFKNSLPWKIRKEFQHFSSLTKSVEDKAKINAVVMGRRTWESIPAAMRPLKGRINVIITRQPNYAVDATDVYVTASLEEALSLLSCEPLIDQVETVWNVGGASIYQEAIEKNLVDRLYMTRILKNFQCDVFFPEYDAKRFEEISDPRVPSELQQEDCIQWSYHVFRAV